MTKAVVSFILADSSRSASGNDQQRTGCTRELINIVPPIKARCVPSLAAYLLLGGGELTELFFVVFFRALARTKKIAQR